MEVLLFKKTTDEDLQIGQEICYKDANGIYSKIGTVTDWIFKNGAMEFSINTSFGTYTADELKLIKN